MSAVLRSAFDVVGVGHIGFEDQELVLCPRFEQVPERFWFSHSGNNGITLF